MMVNWPERWHWMVIRKVLKWFIKFTYLDLQEISPGVIVKTYNHSILEVEAEPHDWDWS